MSRGLLAIALAGALSAPIDARQAPAPQTPPAQAPAPQTQAPQPPSAPAAPPSAAAPVVPPERVTFDEAIRQALQRNPSVVVAAADILRAEGLLRQARAVIMPGVEVTGTNTTLDDARGLEGQTFTARNTFSAALSISMPIFAPAEWARRVQAEDERRVAEGSVEDVKRQIAVATAQAYLAVIAAHRVVDSQVRARDTAQAFYDYAAERLKAGAGSRLTALQAQQTLSTDQALVEQSQLALFRAQEALGVLVTSERPLDAVDEPAFEIPDEPSTLATADQQIQQRADIRLGNLQVGAARRIVTDSWKDWLPSVTGIFQPAYQHPGSLVSPERSWRALVQFSVPVFDAGERRGVKMVREAALRQTEAVAGRAAASGQVRDPHRV